MISLNYPHSWVRPIVLAGFWLAVASASAAILSGFGVRLEWWSFRSGLSVFMYASVGGAFALLLSLVGALLSPPKGFQRYTALGGVFLGLLIAGNFVSWYHTARSFPPIHDISTDTKDPPALLATLPDRQGAMNPAEYGGPELAAVQAKAYPSLQPLVVHRSEAEVWDACLSTARKMGWNIIRAEPSSRRIEATATTFWFGFKDDVVVRLTPENQGVRVDVRSVSRVGKGDAGTNAKRIREFLDRLTAALPS